MKSRFSTTTVSDLALVRRSVKRLLFESPCEIQDAWLDHPLASYKNLKDLVAESGIMKLRLRSMVFKTM